MVHGDSVSYSLHDRGRDPFVGVPQEPGKSYIGMSNSRRGATVMPKKSHTEAQNAAEFRGSQRRATNRIKS